MVCCYCKSFEFKVIHKLGKNHFGVDFLSRATPKKSQSGIDDRLLDAHLFGIKRDMEGLDLKNYLMKGEFLEGCPIRKNVN